VTFTNNDLKWLKNIASTPIKGEIVTRVEVPADEMLSLIARLEAAERVCADVGDDPFFSESIEAWRKAAGK